MSQPLPMLSRAFRTVSVVLAGQLGVQAAGFLSGIAVVRLLSIADYAHYTAVNSLIGMGAVLNDAGVANRTLGLAGRSWNCPEQVADTLRSASNFRWKLATLVGVFLVPFGALMLHQAGAGPTSVLVLLGLLIPVFFLALEAQLQEIPLKLAGRHARLQTIQAIGGLLRAGLVAGLLLAVPSAWTAVAAILLVQLWTLHRLRASVERLRLPMGRADPALNAEFTSAVGRTFPISLYYALSGQLSQVLVSVLGNVEALAGVGALGRFSLAFTVLTAALGYTGLPWFARYSGGSLGLLRGFLAIFGGYSLAVVGLWAGLVLASPWLLLLLGPAYSGLEVELAVSLLGAALACIAGAAYQLGAVRSLLPPAGPMITATIVVQALGIAWFPVGTLQGVLWLGVVTQAWLLLAQALYVLRGLRQQGRGEA